MRKHWLVAALVSATAVAGNDIGQGSAKSPPGLEEASAKFKIPESLTAEHKELHAELTKAIQAGGETARAAQAVARVLHSHFEKEELFALPPLGLLQQVSAGTVTREMEAVLPLTEKLKADLPDMLKEHKTIVVELDQLRAAAEKENHEDVVEFAVRLKEHARNEEQVLYPAAMLVGEMVKAKLGVAPRPSTARDH